jgi:hypothetical protein
VLHLYNVFIQHIEKLELYEKDSYLLRLKKRG